MKLGDSIDLWKRNGNIDKDQLEDYSKFLKKELICLISADSSKIQALNKVIKDLQNARNHLKKKTSNYVESPIAIRHSSEYGVFEKHSKILHNNSSKSFLGKFGALSLTNLAFSFLKRVWRSGMDNDLCHDVLYDALETVRMLPPVLLNQDEDKIGNEVWNDVITKTQNFLKSVILNQITSSSTLKSSTNSEALLDQPSVSSYEHSAKTFSLGNVSKVPLRHRQLALVLLFELALQQASLSSLLNLVSFIFKLSSLGNNESKYDKKKNIKLNNMKNGNGDKYLCDDCDEEDEEEDEVKYIPLVPTLNKLKEICMQLAEKEKYNDEDDDDVLDESFDDKSSYISDDQEMKPFEIFLDLNGANEEESDLSTFIHTILNTSTTHNEASPTIVKSFKTNLNTSDVCNSWFANSSNIYNNNFINELKLPSDWSHDMSMDECCVYVMSYIDVLVSKLLQKQQRNTAFGFNLNNKNKDFSEKQPLYFCGKLNKMMNLHYAINRDIPKDTYIKQVALSTNEVIVLTLNGKIYLMDLNMTEKVLKELIPKEDSNNTLSHSKPHSSLFSSVHTDHFLDQVIALTDDGEAYIWRHKSNEQAELRALSDLEVPVTRVGLPGMIIIKVSLSENFIFLLSREGSLYYCEIDSKALRDIVVTLVEGCPDVEVTGVVAGNNYRPSLIHCADGSVYTFQKTPNQGKNAFKFKHCSQLWHIKVKRIVSSSSSLVALITFTGDLYFWLSSCKDSQPPLFSNLLSKNFNQSSFYSHISFPPLPPKPSDKLVEPASQNELLKIHLPDKVLDVSFGVDHALVSMESGWVFCMGSNDQNQIDCSYEKLNNKKLCDCYSEKMIKSNGQTKVCYKCCLEFKFVTDLYDSHLSPGNKHQQFSSFFQKIKFPFSPKVNVFCSAYDSFVWIAPDRLEARTKGLLSTQYSDNCLQHLDYMLSSMMYLVDGSCNDSATQAQEIIVLSVLHLIELQVKTLLVNESETKKNKTDLNINTNQKNYRKSFRKHKKFHRENSRTTSKSSDHHEDMNINVLNNLKQKVILLASNHGVLSTVQKAAQSVLRAGWRVLIPSNEERLTILFSLLQNYLQNSSEKITRGSQFLSDLLLDAITTFPDLVEKNIKHQQKFWLSCQNDRKKKEKSAVWVEDKASSPSEYFSCLLSLKEPNLYTSVGQHKLKHDLINMSKSHDSAVATKHHPIYNKASDDVSEYRIGEKREKENHSSHEDDPAFLEASHRFDALFLFEILLQINISDYKEYLTSLTTQNVGIGSASLKYLLTYQSKLFSLLHDYDHTPFNTFQLDEKQKIEIQSLNHYINFCCNLFTEILTYASNLAETQEDDKGHKPNNCCKNTTLNLGPLKDLNAKTNFKKLESILSGFQNHSIGIFLEDFVTHTLLLTMENPFLVINASFPEFLTPLLQTLASIQFPTKQPDCAFGLSRFQDFKTKTWKNEIMVRLKKFKQVDLENMKLEGRKVFVFEGWVYDAEDLRSVLTRNEINELLENRDASAYLNSGCISLEKVHSLKENSLGILLDDHIEAKSPKIDQEADCYFAHLYHQISLTLGVWCRKKMHAEISFGPPKSVTRWLDSAFLKVGMELRDSLYSQVMISCDNEERQQNRGSLERLQQNCRPKKFNQNFKRKSSMPNKTSPIKFSKVEVDKNIKNICIKQSSEDYMQNKGKSLKESKKDLRKYMDVISILKAYALLQKPDKNRHNEFLQDQKIINDFFNEASDNHYVEDATFNYTQPAENVCVQSQLQSRKHIALQNTQHAKKESPNQTCNFISAQMRSSPVLASKVLLFSNLIDDYCRQHHISITVGQAFSHPLNNVFRLFITVASLYLNLTGEIYKILNKQKRKKIWHSMENKNKQKCKRPADINDNLNLPRGLSSVCRLAYQLKKHLIKIHQEKDLSYEEICRPFIHKLTFLLNYILTPTDKSPGRNNSQTSHNSPKTSHLLEDRWTKAINYVLTTKRLQKKEKELKENMNKMEKSIIETTSEKTKPTKNVSGNSKWDFSKIIISSMTNFLYHSGDLDVVSLYKCIEEQSRRISYRISALESLTALTNNEQRLYPLTSLQTNLSFCFLFLGWHGVFENHYENHFKDNLIKKNLLLNHNVNIENQKCSLGLNLENSLKNSDFDLSNTDKQDTMKKSHQETNIKNVINTNIKRNMTSCKQQTAWCEDPHKSPASCFSGIQLALKFERQRLFGLNQQLISWSVARSRAEVMRGQSEQASNESIKKLLHCVGCEEALKEDFICENKRLRQKNARLFPLLLANIMSTDLLLSSFTLPINSGILPIVDSFIKLFKSGEFGTDSFSQITNQIVNIYLKFVFVQSLSLSLNHHFENDPSNHKHIQPSLYVNNRDNNINNEDVQNMKNDFNSQFSTFSYDDTISKDFMILGAKFKNIYRHNHSLDFLHYKYALRKLSVYLIRILDSNENIFVPSEDSFSLFDFSRFFSSNDILAAYLANHLFVKKLIADVGDFDRSNKIDLKKKIQILKLLEMIFPYIQHHHNIHSTIASVFTLVAKVASQCPLDQTLLNNDRRILPNTKSLLWCTDTPQSLSTSFASDTTSLCEQIRTLLVSFLSFEDKFGAKINKTSNERSRVAGITLSIIMGTMKKIPSLVDSMESDSDQLMLGMGVLAFLGGVDEHRIRVGCRVLNNEGKNGLVQELLKEENKVLVQFTGQLEFVPCALQDLEVIPLKIDKMLSMETDEWVEAWRDLLYTAFCFTSRTLKTKITSKPINYICRKLDKILLKEYSLCFLLLKASSLLFNKQTFLRKVLLCEAPMRKIKIDNQSKYDHEGECCNDNDESHVLKNDCETEKNSDVQNDENEVVIEGLLSNSSEHDEILDDKTTVGNITHVVSSEAIDVGGVQLHSVEEEDFVNKVTINNENKADFINKKMETEKEYSGEVKEKMTKDDLKFSNNSNEVHTNNQHHTSNKNNFDYILSNKNTESRFNNYFTISSNRRLFDHFLQLSIEACPIRCNISPEHLQATISVLLQNLVSNCFIANVCKQATKKPTNSLLLDLPKQTVNKYNISKSRKFKLYTPSTLPLTTTTPHPTYTSSFSSSSFSTLARFLPNWKRRFGSKDNDDAARDDDDNDNDDFLNGDDDDDDSNGEDSQLGMGTIDALSPGSNSSTHPPPQLINKLIDMGFPLKRIHRAISQLNINVNSEDETMLIDQICCWLFENEDDDDDYDDNDYEDNATNIDEEKEEDEEEKEDGEYNEIGADADEDVGFNGEKQSKFNSEKLVSFEEEEEEEKGGTKPLAHNSDDNCRNNFNSPEYLCRKNFASVDEYALYVKSVVHVGMLVRLHYEFDEDCEEEDEDDVAWVNLGYVKKLANDSLHDLNVLVDWTNWNGSYWVKYSDLDLNNLKISSSVRLGTCVRVKSNIETPFYGWGKANKKSFGYVSGISVTGEEISVNFPCQFNWSCFLDELEIINASLPPVTALPSCAVCQETITNEGNEGCNYSKKYKHNNHKSYSISYTDHHVSSYHATQHNKYQGNSSFSSNNNVKHCSICNSEFNVCSSCLSFQESHSFIPCGHIMHFKSTSSSSSPSFSFTTLPGDDADETWMGDKAVLLTDWDSYTFEKSDVGPGGKKILSLEMQDDVVIKLLTLKLDSLELANQISFMTILAGNSQSPLSKFLGIFNTTHNDDLLVLLKNVEEHYSFIEIQFVHKSSCKDIPIKIEHFKISGIKTRRQMGKTLASHAQDHRCYLMPDAEHYENIILERMTDHRESQDVKQTALGSIAEEKKILSERVRRIMEGESAEKIGGQVRVFVWGLNDKDQLGSPKGFKVKTPVMNEYLSSLNCVQLAGGCKSLFCVTQDGKLYASGDSTNGRLGLGITSGHVSVPRQVTALSQYVIKKVAVHSGGRHAMALTVDGKVFSWGEGEDWKLGHPNLTTSEGSLDTRRKSGQKPADLATPKLIECLRSKRVRDIACGSSHSAAILSNGDLYTWGFGEYGRLGHGDSLTQIRPKKVEALNGHRVVQVSLGSRDAQTLALTDEGKLFSWGDGDFGKLGRGGSDSCNVPLLVERLSGVGVIQIECGAQFSLALTKNGQVWTWGKGDYYRLGHGTDAHVRKPQVVDALKPYRVVHVAVGALHCLAVTEQGKVFSWGDNDHGQQGNGCTLVNKKPTLVHGLEGYKITKAACGSSHSMVWSTLDTNHPYSHQPLLFNPLKDPLGEALLEKEYETDLSKVDVKSGYVIADTNTFTDKHTYNNRDMFDPTDTVLSFQNRLDKFIAINNFLQALKIHFARKAIVESLRYVDEASLHKGASLESINKCTSLSSMLSSLSNSITSTSEFSEKDILHRDLNLNEVVDGNGSDDCIEKQESEFEVEKERRKYEMTNNFIASSVSCPEFVSNKTKKNELQAIGKIGEENTYEDEHSYEHQDIESVNTKKEKEIKDLKIFEKDLCETDQIQKESIESTMNTRNSRGESDEAKSSGEEDVAASNPSSPIKSPILSSCHQSRPPSTFRFPSLSKTLQKLQNSNSIDYFISDLGLHEARVVVDLLKLSLASRVFAPSSTNVLSYVLQRLASNNSQTSEMLLELCVTELEDFASNSSSVNKNAYLKCYNMQPVTRESSHPYNEKSNLSGCVEIPGATGLRVEFDSQCCMEKKGAVLILMDSHMRIISIKSGKKSSNWGSIELPGNKLHWKFKSYCIMPCWGWRFTVFPNVVPASLNTASEQQALNNSSSIPSSSFLVCYDWSIPDRSLMSLPSVELASILLNIPLFSHQWENAYIKNDRAYEKNDKNHHNNILMRLVSSLAACSQINSLEVGHKIWALQRLRMLVNLKNHHVTAIQNFPGVGQLLRSLPSILKRQYEYEDPIVKSGKQLMYSRFFKVLVALACDLGLEISLPTSSSEKDDQIQNWHWFHRYCTAVHTISCLQKRKGDLPKEFRNEVGRKVAEIEDEDEPVFTNSVAAYDEGDVGDAKAEENKDDQKWNEEKEGLDPTDTSRNASYALKAYESHQIFTVHHDQQLLHWLKKKPNDWVLSSSSIGQIYVWGHNHRGQLGGVEGAKVKVPLVCEALSILKPQQLAGGEQTLFAVTSDGKVYAAGYGASGRLGIGGTDSVAVLTLLDSIQHTHIKKISVNSGGKHCLALTAGGEVFSWGEGEDGKLGHGNKTSLDRPRVIDTLRSVEVTEIAAGGAHSACIIAEGKLFTWGKGRYGRLGHGDGEDQSRPKMVDALKDYKVIDVACGSGDAQTLCLTSDGSVWSWGDGDYGKLGRGGSEGCKVPMKIDCFQGLGVLKIDCGSQFSVALTRAGSVYTWGKGDYHRLGHGTEVHVRRPKRILYLQGKKVVSIACGSLHCICCTDAGEVYAWGDNDEGQLGDGSMNAVQKPKIITVLQGKKINKLACGSAHSLAWSTSKPNYSEKLPKQAPVEYNLLTSINMKTVRNRLILLSNFAELVCPIIPMLDIKFYTNNQFKHRPPGHQSNLCIDFPALDTNCNHLSNSKNEIQKIFPSFKAIIDNENISVNNHNQILRDLLVFSAKESVFKKIVQHTMIRDKLHGPVINVNRLQSKKAKGKTEKGKDAKLASIEKTVYWQICEKMMVLENTEYLLMPHRVWKVKFIGESVDDCGGGYSESIAEMCDELLNGSLPLLILTANGRTDDGTNKDCFTINADLESSVLNDKMMTFLGVLMGIAIRTGSPLNLALSGAMWKSLTFASLTLNDLNEIDKHFIPSLMHIKNMDEHLLRGIEMPFSTTGTSGKEMKLSHKYTKITPSNRDEYIKLALDYRLHEFDRHISLVRQGLSKVVPVPLLPLFTPTELETMVCGSPDIPLDLLKSMAVYKGIEASSALICWFWQVMEEFTNDERSFFLRFVWGRTRLPRTVADFRDRDFVIQIIERYDPPDDYLPESHTCFFLLKMPRYTNKNSLRDKLKYAIYFCKSIDTDDYARVALASPHVDSDSSADEISVAVDVPGTSNNHASSNRLISTLAEMNASHRDWRTSDLNLESILPTFEYIERLFYGPSV